MKWFWRILAAAVLLVALVLAWLSLADRRTKAPVAATAVDLADPALIARGAYLATIGDCAGCHTARGGRPYAGGRSLPTPFGSVPAPNLTPDGRTGLGRWSFEDFWQALHAGRGRDGRLLYPAFPYTAYTRVDRGDALALFAYLKSLPPVYRTSPVSGVRFPYDLRPAVAAWRALYFHQGTYRADPSRSKQWNRGAYLVEGLGHCNECHVARDTLGGLREGAALSGGRIPMQNWYAPDLSLQAHGGLEGWSRDDVVRLLRTGQNRHGAAFGPMAEVVRLSTQHLAEDDLQAIATYLAALPARPAPDAAAHTVDRRAVVDAGRTLYRDRCAACHGKDGGGVPGVYPALDGNIAVTAPVGVNAVRMVLLGGFAPATASQPRPYSMPPYAQQLGDAQVAAVVTYIRQAWSNRAGPVSAAEVAADRQTPLD